MQKVFTPLFSREVFTLNSSYTFNNTYGYVSSTRHPFTGNRNICLAYDNTTDVMLMKKAHSQARRGRNVNSQDTIDKL